MSQRMAVPAEKKATMPLMSGRLQHAAVRFILERSVPPVAQRESGFGHDFSWVPARTVPTVSRAEHSSCPVSPKTCPFGGACHTCPVQVQAKLKVGQPGDKYEREADRMADLVMRTLDPRLQRQVEPEDEEEEKHLQAKSLVERITPLVQRQLDPDEEEEELVQAKSADDIQLQRQEEMPEEEGEEQDSIQAKRAGEPTPHTSRGLKTQIHSLRGSGQPLPQSVRNFFEPRFGYDFSRVRIHTGAKAAKSTRSIDALAYTVGKDIVFGGGHYAPQTQRGRQLLAHELTHTIQQGTCPATNALPSEGTATRSCLGRSDQAANQTADTETSQPQAILRGMSNPLLPPAGLVTQNDDTEILQRLPVSTSPSQATPTAGTRPSPAVTSPRQRVRRRGTNPAACMQQECDRLERQSIPRSRARLRRLTNNWLTASLACVRSGAAGSNASHYQQIVTNNVSELQAEERGLLQSLQTLTRQRLKSRDYMGWLRNTCAHKQREAELEFHHNIIFESRSGQPEWGMHPAPWNRIANALSLLPDEALWASPTLITFRRETAHQTIPSAGGAVDVGAGVIRIFDVGLGQHPMPRSAKLRLPRTAQTLTHEVGHIVMNRVPKATRNSFFEDTVHWHDYPWAWVTASATRISRWQAERSRLRAAVGFTDTQLDTWLSNLVVDQRVVEGAYTYVKRSHTPGGNSYYLQAYETSRVPAGLEFEYARTDRGDYLAELYALAVSRPEFLHTTLPSNQISWLKREVFHTPADLSELAREVALREPFQTQFLVRASRLFSWEQLNSLLQTLLAESQQPGTALG